MEARAGVAHIFHMLRRVESIKDICQPLRMPRLDTALAPT